MVTEVLRGYKQTEVGIIPEDWDVSRLDNKTIKIGSGITPRGGERVYKSEGRSFVRSQNVGWGILLMDDIAFIDDETHDSFNSTEIRVNDVFLNITGASIGRSAVADSRVEKGNVNQHVCIIRTNPQELDPHFLNYILLSSIGQQQIDIFQAGGNRQGLNFGQIGSFQIPIPTLEEQHFIVKALIDVDSIIQTLDHLITKKKNIKQGMLQELLTGKRRSKGFSGEWKNISFNDAFYITAGGDLDKISFSESQDDRHPFPIYSNSLINSGLYGFSSKFQYEKESITITARGTVGKANARSHKYSAIGRVLILKPIQKLDCFFVAEYINNKIKFSIESTGVPQLTTPQISKYLIDLPELDEQLVISNILSDMDSEIQELKQNRDKYIMIKQGMMQKLLTGEIRLV